MSSSSPRLRIYADTCVYLDLIVKNLVPHPDTQEPRWVAAKALFDAVNDNRVVLAASALTDAELRCVAAIKDHSGRVMAQVQGWLAAEDTQWVDLDRTLAREAERLTKEWHVRRADPAKRLRTADAIHLAAAARLKCDYLMTHDDGFPIGHEVEGVRVVRPMRLWEKTLFDAESA